MRRLIVHGSHGMPGVGGGVYIARRVLSLGVCPFPLVLNSCEFGV